MSKHKPTLQDAAADLYRCVYISTKEGIDSENFARFLHNAEKILANFNSSTVKVAEKLIQKSKDNGKELIKRQEDLLTASLLLK